MKKLLTILFLFVNISTILPAYACEVCGSGFGSYLGIMPQYGQHFLGIRYQQQSYLSVPNPLHHSEESFYQTEIWGKFNIHRKVQLFFFLPYTQNSRLQYGKTTQMQGIGDISAQLNYILFNSGDSIFTSFKQTLTLGAGIKLPTGNYQNPELERLVNPNFQLGTGSIDYQVHLNYTIRYSKLGLNTNLRHKFNGKNPQNNHRFGNQSMISTQLFWWQNLIKCSVLPTIGVDYEHAQPNTFEGDEQRHTGGHATFLNLGTELYFRYFSAGLTWQKPINQSLAEGEIIAKNRLSAHLTWIF